jgi:hypothetical protein
MTRKEKVLEFKKVKISEHTRKQELLTEQNDLLKKLVQGIEDVKAGRVTKLK